MYYRRVKNKDVSTSVKFYGNIDFDERVLDHHAIVPEIPKAPEPGSEISEMLHIHNHFFTRTGGGANGSSPVGHYECRCGIILNGIFPTVEARVDFERWLRSVNA